jgi:hypothetical protein
MINCRVSKQHTAFYADLRVLGLNFVDNFFDFFKSIGQHIEYRSHVDTLI